MLEQVADEVGRDEPGAAGDENAAHAQSSAIDEVQGPVLHHALDSAEVLADERQDEALHAEHGDDERAEQERAREVRVRDPVDDAVGAERERRERADDAEDDPGRLDRLRPEAGEHVEREPREPERRVARRVLPGGVADVDLDDGRPAREHERLRELLTPDRAEHRLHRVAPVGVERAAEVGDVDAREAAQHAVDEPRRQRSAPRVVARGATAARDVVSRLDRLDQARDVLGRVLQVAVHRHDDRAARAGEPRVHRRVLAELRFSRTARTRASPSWIRSSTAKVPSVEPSST